MPNTYKVPRFNLYLTKSTFFKWNKFYFTFIYSTLELFRFLLGIPSTQRTFFNFSWSKSVLEINSLVFFFDEDFVSWFLKHVFSGYGILCRQYFSTGHFTVSWFAYFSPCLCCSVSNVFFPLWLPSGFSLCFLFLIECYMLLCCFVPFYFLRVCISNLLVFLSFLDM